MESVKPPDAVNWTGNIDHEWRMFKQRFTLYLQAVGLDEASDARKIALLLTVAGPQSIEVFNTLVFAQAEDKGKYDVVMEKFDVHCTPRTRLLRGMFFALVYNNKERRLTVS